MSFDQPVGRPSPRELAPGFGLALLCAVVVWIGAFAILDPVENASLPLDRFVFALRCCVVAIVATLLLGIEAVAHERLSGTAFNPLSGSETPRLQVNQRYVQNTLEQVTLFVPALLVLASYCRDGAEMRSVVAATIVFVLGRLAFWTGYRVSPSHRVYGLVGTAQTMLILLYGVVRFGHEVAGLAGAVSSVVLFLLAELIIVRDVRR